MNTKLANDLNISVKVGGRDLIFSGIVHLEQPDYELEVNGLKFGFCFKEDSEQSRYVGRIEGEKLYIDLFNHHNSLGEGIFTPIEVGLLNDKKLSLTYFVSTVNKEENKRRFEFAFYLGDV